MKTIIYYAPNATREFITSYMFYGGEIDLKVLFLDAKLASDYYGLPINPSL